MLIEIGLTMVVAVGCGALIAWALGA